MAGVNYAGGPPTLSIMAFGSDRTYLMEVKARDPREALDVARTIHLDIIGVVMYSSHWDWQPRFW
jgi:hypothetical protein